MLIEDFFKHFNNILYQPTHLKEAWNNIILEKQSSNKKFSLRFKKDICIIALGIHKYLRSAHMHNVYLGYVEMFKKY